MKTLLKLVFGLVILLVLAAVLVPIIFKDNLVQIVKDEANNDLNAEVDFGDFDLSLISSFPDLTFSINDVKVLGKEEFNGLVLADIGELSLTLDLMNVVTGSQISIKSFAVNDADINVKVLENGKANYDITLPSEEATEEEETSSGEDYKIALQNYSFNNVNITYDDQLYAFYMAMEGFDHSGKGDFTMDIFLLETQSKIEAFTVKYEGLAYLNKTAVDLNMDLDMDMTNFKFTFKDNKLTLNQLVMVFDGWLAMPSHDIDMDLTFGAPNNTFKSILSLVPAIYAKDFDGVETSGNFSLSGMAKGTYNDTQLPAFNMALLVGDARFNYPDLPKSAENINIDLKVDNPDGIEDNTVIDLKKFHIELGNNPIDFSMYLKDPISDPDFTGKIQSQINFESLAEVVPLDEGMKFSGTVTADASFAGKMSALENEMYDQFQASGQMMLNGFQYEDPTLDYPINIKSAYMTFSPEKIDLSKFEMVLGNSDINLKGSVSNFLPYYLHDQVLQGNLQLQSNLIDSDQLMGEEETEEGESASTDSTTEDYEVIEIPQNLDLAFSAEIGKLLYDGMTMEKLNGLVTVKGGVAKLNNFKMNMMQGAISMTGAYDTKDLANPTADFGMAIDRFDIQETFETFNSVQKLAPIAERAKGKFSTNFTFSTALLSNLEPDLNTLDGIGLLQTHDVTIEGTKMLKKIGDVMKNDKYTKMELNDTKIKFKFEDGTMTTEHFDMNLGGQKVTTSGKSYFDGTIDYKMATKMPKTAFGNAATSTVNDLLGQVKNKTGVDLSASSTLDLELLIGGTVTEPTVKPSISGVVGEGGAKGAVEEVKEAVKEKIKEKVEESKEDVNKRIAEERAKLVKQATVQGDKLIAEAQKQKANLENGATNQAANLKKEAEAQAAKLKKDAGGNPIKKKAAELAGDKLIKEADKKGAKLIEKANSKGDDLVNKAKAKKANLIKQAEEKEISI